MAVRHDKFAPGDEVIWTERLRDQGVRMVDHEGPFRIATVEDAPYQPGYAGDELYQSNWQSMGHTQFVTIEGRPERWSGAYFEKVEEEDEQLRYETETRDLSDDRDALASAGFVEGE